MSTCSNYSIPRWIIFPLAAGGSVPAAGGFYIDTVMRGREYE